MSYSLINGAPINGDEGGDITLLPSGLDLLSAGAHTAVGGTTAGDASPLELGDPLALYAIEPPGLELLDAGTHIGLHDMDFTPPGLDLVDHGIPAMVVNPVAGDAEPLEIGDLTLQIGVPINARPAGLDLVLAGLHVASVGVVLPSDGFTVAGNARPLQLGSPALTPAAASTTAGGAQPLELGTAAIGVALSAGGAEPLELGTPGTGYATNAGAAQPLVLGSPGLAMAFTVQGIDLVVAGLHTVVSGGTFTVAGGGEPLTLGDHGPLGYASITRQHFPLDLGNLSINRGTTC